MLTKSKNSFAILLLRHCCGGVGNDFGDFGLIPHLLGLKYVRVRFAKCCKAARAADSDASSLVLHGFPINTLSPGNAT